MGNLCGEERREFTSFMQSKLCLSKLINKTYIHILQGDILNEQSNAILNAAPEPLLTNIVRQRNIAVPQLIPGKAIIQSYQQNGIQNIIHLKLPRSFNYDDYETQIQSFVDTFEMASSKYIECISFTDPPRDISSNQSKDFYAKILFQSFQFFALNNPNSRIKLLKVVNQDLNTVNVYMKELLQVVVISQKQSVEQIPIDKETQNNDKDTYEQQKEETKTQIEIIINQQEQQQLFEQTKTKEQEQQQQELSKKEQIAQILLNTQKQHEEILNQLQITQQEQIIQQEQNQNKFEETKTTTNEIKFNQQEFIMNFSQSVISQVLEESVKKFIN